MDTLAPPTQSYQAPDDAVWFITGCSTGIGKALAEAIIKHGSYRLVATARKVDALSYVPDSPNYLKLTCDVTSPPDIDAAIAAAVERFGRLDVVVNNAGYGLWGDAEAATDEQARRLVDTLFWGTARVTQHAVRVMRDENPKSGSGKPGGLVLNVTSMGGFIASPGGAFYHAAKWAVEGFTEGFAREVRPEWGISFCILEPAGTRTDFAGRSMEFGPVHPAYAAPDCPTRKLEALMANPEVTASWVSVEGAIGVIIKLASQGGRIPLRLPIGAVAWAVLRGDCDSVIKDFEEFKTLSESAV